MEPHLSLGCEACPSENMSLKSGDCGVITCSQDHAPPKKPANKQTRQWAAWTHQEEENFFAALRQVGKNFEKITCRVQSKNKDQVRHYYYRLVRRMNKFLGPEICLDAKNSKETNAAMLRWWSLLEKYSCKASKLHLKPRRFKMFIETLEYQLLRDRKKRIRKRPSNGGSCPTAGPATLSNQGRASGHANHSVEVVLLDGQNIQKLGSGKGSSFRRDVNIGLARSNIKGDSSSVKQARQRRKPAGTVSTAAYKRWEKAAIAGVSLVADAAEHLERVACDKVFEHSQGTPGLEVVGKDGSSLPTSQNLLIENNAQTSMKLKLQLFPFDESTRKALEMDNHNPHLELTLSGRKKISSVLEHLNRKWGNSSIASGEIMLLPYCIQRDNLVGYQKWSQDSVLSAADVYALIGSPPIFRLRYGWFSNSEPQPAISQASSSTQPVHHTEQFADKEKQNGCLISLSPQHGAHNCDNLGDQNKDLQVFLNKAPPVALSSANVSGKISNPNTDLLNSSDHAHDNAWNRRETGNEAVISQTDDADDGRLRNGTSFSAGEWADSLTNISVGDLLSEVSHNIDANYVDQSPPGSQYLQQMPFSSDSFDAAIAAHIFKHQSKTGCQPTLASHGSSIWDAEVTCDAFSFQKNIVICENVRNASGSTSLEACKQIGESSRALYVTSVEELPEAEEPMDDDPADEDQMDVSQSDPHDMDDTPKDLNGLTDIYWPDSLGPLDLDIPSCKYHTDNLILSDSLSGLNRLIASSLDAFQNCSFFGLDNKEASSTVEARESVSFSDYKIGSEV